MYELTKLLNQLMNKNNMVFYDFRAKIFLSINIFFNIYCSKIMSYLCQKCNKFGVIDFVSKVKCVEKLR